MCLIKLLLPTWDNKNKFVTHIFEKKRMHKQCSRTSENSQEQYSRIS